MRAVSGTFAPPGGPQLPTRAWLPDEGTPIRARIAVVHGLGEHVGRYADLAGRLTAAGYAVHGYDQRGHGAAPGERCQIERFERLVDDLGAFVADLRSHRAPASLALLGHSMGGVVALRAVQTGAVAPDALVLSSPALRDGTPAPAWVRRLVARLAEPFPGMPTVRIDTRALSRDAAEVAAYERDPANYHGPIKARIASEMARHGELGLAQADRVRVPLLIVHGREDRLARPDASVALHAALAGRDATLRLFDDGPHELFHDPLRERVTEDLLAWLDARVPRVA